MILLESCPVCGNSKFQKKLICTDHTKSKEKFKIVSCGTCGFTLTNPRPKNEKLNDYYKSEMYISHTNNSKGTLNWIYQTVRKHAIKSKVSLLIKNSIIGAHLDIGCGTGEFLNACKRKGFKTQGVEPSKLARDQAIKNYNLSVSEKSDLKQFKNSEFDSISMWHALEHIPNLNETVTHINRILSEKGRVFIAVPNLKSWDAKYYKEYWAAWDVPIHLWHFTKKTISQLFSKHEFRLVKTKGMIFDSFYVSVLSEEFKNGSKNLIKSFIIGLISNLYALFTKRGYSSTIYIFEKKSRNKAI